MHNKYYFEVEQYINIVRTDVIPVRQFIATLWMHFSTFHIIWPKSLWNKMSRCSGRCLPRSSCGTDVHSTSISISPFKLGAQTDDTGQPTVPNWPESPVALKRIRLITTLGAGPPPSGSVRLHLLPTWSLIGFAYHCHRVCEAGKEIRLSNSSRVLAKTVSFFILAIADTGGNIRKLPNTVPMVR